MGQRVKIEKMGLTTTAYNAVLSLGVKTAGQLAKFTWRQMLASHPHFRRQGVKESIAGCLKGQGLSLLD